MASPAIQHAEFQRQFSVTPHFYLLSDLAASMGHAPVHSKAAARPGVSTASGLKGAKAAMVAIGLEAAAALCVYGVWQVWHILR